MTLYYKMHNIEKEGFWQTKKIPFGISFFFVRPARIGLTTFWARNQTLYPLSYGRILNAIH